MCMHHKKKTEIAPRLTIETLEENNWQEEVTEIRTKLSLWKRIKRWLDQPVSINKGAEHGEVSKTLQQ